MNSSRHIALGGVFSSLCLVVLFMTGLVPFATYAFPAVAGALLVVVRIECGTKTALLSYIGISALAVFVVPDREATLIFVVFFGYYPIIKQKIDELRSRLLKPLVKLLIFNSAVAGGYAVAIRLLGMTQLLEDIGDLGRYSAAIFLLLFNLVFIVYDFALTRYIMIYLHYWRRKLLRQ